MAKHPVPKKKTSKVRTSRRYKTFANGVRKKLTNFVSLSDCPKCGEKTMLHHACPNCGTYKGRDVMDKQKKIDKITKIKA